MTTNLVEANRLARDLMDHYGLQDWRLEWGNAKNQFGVCYYIRRILRFSRPLTKARSLDEFRNTVLHEIAHALVGHDHGHDRVWRAMFISMGGNGKRLSGGVPTEVTRAMSNYILRCAVTGRELGTRQRRTMAAIDRLICKCHREQVLWEENTQKTL